MDIEKGEAVWYYRDGWRTGVYLRTIERGRNFGMMEIQPTCGEKKIMVAPEHVHSMEGK